MWKGKIMMKRIFILFLAFIMFFSLPSCEPNGTFDRNKQDVALSILCNGVPYFYYMSAYDAERFDKVKVLEKDAYGRILFEYICTSQYHWQSMTVLLICQKTDEQKAFYYEDYCYLLALCDDHDTAAVFSDEDVAALKEKNDWDQPMNPNKMSSTWLKIIPSNSVNTAKIDLVYRDYLDVEEEIYVYYEDLEGNVDGIQTIIARVYYGDAVSTERYAYSHLICWYSQGNQGKGEILACEEYEETLDCQEVIHSFKEKTKNLRDAVNEHN